MSLIRRSYPAESNVLLLSYIFFTACFFSYQMFGVTFHNLESWKDALLGMVLVGVAATIMVMIVWEEMLFPIKVNSVKGGVEFRNHRTKLKTQVLLYTIIPLIFCFINYHYYVNHFHFAIWIVVCMVPPFVEKIFSGVKNYNDYLKLTSSGIEYKNNEKEGYFETKDVQNITIIEDERKVIKKIQVIDRNNKNVIIDLDEMELEAFYEPIYKFIVNNYKHLLNQSNNSIGLTN